MKIFSIEKYPNGTRKIKIFNFTVYKYSKNNSCINGLNNIIDASNSANVNIKINGNNNKIMIKTSNSNNYLINLVIDGDNNVVNINNIIKGVLNITIGNSVDLPANNCSCYFGKNLSITGSTDLMLYENNSSFECGDDVIISHGTTIRGSDGHSVVSETGEILNQAHSIKIGNHVWIGQDVLISKNTEIPDDCIVGARAVITKKFNKTNCILAGVPAKVMKENIHWATELPDRYIPLGSLGRGSDNSHI